MNRRLLLIALFCISALVVPNLFGYPPAVATVNFTPKTELNEAFEPSLCKKLNSVDALVEYINTTYKGNKNSTEFLHYISNVITLRFYHGYSYYSLSDNWIAALSGMLVWDDLSAIVLPDDILKHPLAACSQQSIVLMECAKRFGMDFRKILFDHHFAVEIKTENKWNFIDVNLEVIPMDKSLDDLLKKGNFLSSYETKLPEDDIARILANPKYGEINSDGAERAAKYQQFAGWLSSFFFVIVFFMQLLVYLHLTNKNKSIL